MAHLRFGSPHAIAPCLYSRGDGTLSYFFSVDRVVALAAAAGLRCLACEYHTVCNRNRRSGVEVRALACVLECASLHYCAVCASMRARPIVVLYSPEYYARC